MKQCTHILTFLFCLFSMAGLLHAEKSQEQTGTLIVTYHTGSKAKRLDRVRFRITDDQGERSMYPKNGAYVADMSKLTRMVVIEDLAPGKYFLDFLVPNVDGLFEGVKPREFTITAGKVVKIDQVITPRYATLRAMVNIKRENPATTPLPTITLMDARNQVAAQSTSGKLEATDLLPGNYVLQFEEIPGYLPPAPHTISLGPNESVGPLMGAYTRAEAPLAKGEEAKPIVRPVQEGTLIVSYDTGPTQDHLDKIRFKIYDTTGKAQMFPRPGAAIEDPLTHGYLVVVKGLPPGEYTIEFLMLQTKQTFETMATQHFTIEEGQTTSVRESLTPPLGKL